MRWLCAHDPKPQTINPKEADMITTITVPGSSGNYSIGYLKCTIV